MDEPLLHYLQSKLAQMPVYRAGEGWGLGLVILGDLLPLPPIFPRLPTCYVLPISWHFLCCERNPSVLGDALQKV